MKSWKKWNRRQIALGNPLSDREWRELVYFDWATRNWSRLSHRRRKKVLARQRRSDRAYTRRFKGDHSRWMKVGRWRTQPSEKQWLYRAVAASAPFALAAAAIGMTRIGGGQ